jgi:tRNA1(Val) A37 N6-methylase TrmN6
VATTDRAGDPPTEDRLLGGRVRLLQPASGYRVAIDPVLLAAAVPAGEGELVLDAGMGTGAAALCLAMRVPGCRVVGIERERSLQRLASDNVALNELQGRIDPMLGDLARPPPRLAPGAYDHVISNPPYLTGGTATRPAGDDRAAAHVADVDLGRWVALCLGMLRARGLLTLIHRADRLDGLLAALHERTGDIVVFPLWPKADAPVARRVLVQARKGARGPLRLARGLVLHYLDGSFTPAAEGVLRHATALDLAAPPDGSIEEMA